MKKLYRTNKGQKIAGVCTGLGEHFDLDPVILRVLFLVCVPFGGIGFLTYLIMWIVVPLKDSNVSGNKSGKRLYLSTSNKKVAGVCGGLGDFFDLDPTIFRVGSLVLVFVGGLGALLYVVLWLVIPKQEKAKKDAPKLSN